MIFSGLAALRGRYKLEWRPVQGVGPDGSAG